MNKENHENQLNKELLEASKETNKRLGVVASLLLKMIPKEGSNLSLKEQVRILDSLGVRPRDIADILGRTSSHINKELVGIRKEKIKNNEQEE